MNSKTIIIAGVILTGIGAGLFASSFPIIVADNYPLIMPTIMGKQEEYQAVITLRKSIGAGLFVSGVLSFIYGLSLQRKEQG